MMSSAADIRRIILDRDSSKREALFRNAVEILSQRNGLERARANGQEEEFLKNLQRKMEKVPEVSEEEESGIAVEEPPQQEPEVRPISKRVKKEKLSVLAAAAAAAVETPVAETPQVAGDMLPPVKPAPKTKKVGKVKTEPVEDGHKRKTRQTNNKSKESVILEELPVPLVDLTNNSRMTRSRIKKEPPTSTIVKESESVPVAPANEVPVNEILNETEKPSQEKQPEKVQISTTPPIEKAPTKPNNKTITSTKQPEKQQIDAGPSQNPNQTYVLSNEPSTTFTVQEPPQKDPPNTETKQTPLKNLTPLKTQIPKFITKTTPQQASSTPYSALKASQKQYRTQKIAKEKKEMEVLKMKEEVLRTIEKNKNKKIGNENKKPVETPKMKPLKINSATIVKAPAKPKYLTQKLPRLPTVDCYDSDEEHPRNVSGRYPTWVESSKCANHIKVAALVLPLLKDRLFEMQVCTPDLKAVFEVIDARKTKRTSSANWKEPPRYARFNETNTVIFSEDEDD